MLNNTSFSNRLKKVMEFYNVSASSFAETIEVPRSSISHILSGRNKPSLEFVLKTIETYQEVDLYWLLKGIGTFPKSTSPTPIENMFPEKKQKELPLEKKSHNQNIEVKNSNFIEDQNTIESDIEKVLIFYKNGTFKEYTNGRNK